MLTLYHGANSVCSIKVRIVLAEKALQWEGRHIDLPKGDQFHPDYLKVNPRAIVPVLDHDGVLIRESSVISEYLDGLSDHNRLMPRDPVAQAKTRIWGLNTLEYHDSVNTLTFASYQRQMLLAKPAEELEARWDAMPDKIRVRKMLDLMENGAHSAHVPVALGRLQRMCAEMEDSLAGAAWLMGPDYGLADALVTAYFFRIDCIGLNRLWESRYPRVTDWYRRGFARPSLDAATAPWLDEAAIDKIRQVGRRTFIEDAEFPDYL
jgi:glutathione S-transferase